MSTAAKWVDYDPDETYDLTTAFPKLQLPLRMNNQDHIKIAVCSSCKTVKNHRFPPVLAAIPEEINAVPMVYRSNKRKPKDKSPSKKSKKSPAKKENKNTRLKRNCNKNI
ncbi:3678_t:CDS:2 [Entrophospora sp. SA101]|nr:3678_t:CDS:2 [Entrophospora sp. SA101]